MPEPPQLALLEVEEQQLHSKSSTNKRISHPISKGESSHCADETHFSDHYSQLVTVVKDGNRSTCEQSSLFSSLFTTINK